LYTGGKYSNCAVTLQRLFTADIGKSPIVSKMLWFISYQNALSIL